MVNVPTHTRQKALKAACAFFGGVKPLAMSTGIDPGNLNGWVNGKPRLSAERVDIVLRAMGLPNGRPDASTVHSWSIKRVLLKDYSPALNLYFPDGAEIARAPWVETSVNLKASFPSANACPNLYAIKDQKVRAILRLPRSLLIQPENIRGVLKWKNGTQANSMLSIPKNKEALWQTGVPSIDEFDCAWGTLPPTSRTISDLEQKIEEEGLTVDDVFGLIENRTKYPSIG